MSVAEKVSYFSRFTVKLIEMLAAGIATAVSGYLVAHLGTYFFSPTPQPPAAVQVAPAPSPPPSATAASKAATRSARAQPTKPTSADSNEPHTAPVEANASTQQARAPANAKEASASRKRATADANAAESKPRDAEDKESVEALVRAALANVDANRPAPPEVPQQAESAPPAAVVAPGPAPAIRSADVPAAGAPHTADLGPPPAQTVPVKAEPLTEVEIKSRPIADVSAVPEPAGQGDSQGSTRANAQEDTGLIAAIKHIPDFLRPPAPAPADDAPRPPLPVGN